MHDTGENSKIKEEKLVRWVLIRCAVCGREKRRLRSQIIGKKRHYCGKFCRRLGWARSCSERGIYTPEILRSMLEHKCKTCAFPGCTETQSPPGKMNRWHACKKHAWWIYVSLSSKRHRREKLLIKRGLRSPAVEHNHDVMGKFRDLLDHDLRLHGYSDYTRQEYLYWIKRFFRQGACSPQELTLSSVDYHLSLLARNNKVKSRSIHPMRCALRFFCRVTLRNRIKQLELPFELFPDFITITKGGLDVATSGEVRGSANPTFG